MANFRVKFTEHFRGFRNGEVGWFSANGAQALVTAGVATAIDAIPGATPIPTILPGQDRHVVLTHHVLAKPATQADSDQNLHEAAFFTTG